LNNNRGNNNRRRSRGNNRSQSGSQLNRIDSRARGNAPQLLDKYRKLAQDASLNGDRVQAEYYLQFADHYFRVIADSRPPREEFRGRGERDSEGSEDEGDFDRGNRRPYEDRSEQSDDGSEDQAPREPAGEFEPSENPFVRDNRQQRSRSRDDRKPRRPRDEERGSDGQRGQPERESIDVAVLPPAINPTEGDAAPEAPAEGEAPKPRRRTRKTKADDGEALENVS
jgi:hypothetical protein